MALIDKFFGRKKTLSQLDRQELRKEEILLTKQRDRLFKKIETISTQKQKIFQQGAQQKSPELRKALAQDFELKTQEQLMTARELNLRSKELLTVSRLRMVKENSEKGRALGRLNLTDKDVAKISQWIEDDAVTQDMYTERLNTILDLGEQSDKDALALAECILNLAVRLRIKVVAEGVETQQQAALLAAAGCTAMQGYWFARPQRDLGTWFAPDAAPPPLAWA